MKKLLFSVFGALALMSCTKSEPINNVDVVLNYRMVESASMTKAVAHMDVLNLIATMLPSEIEFTLTDSENQSRTIRSGETTNLSVGTYHVTASYDGSEKVYVTGNDSYMGQAPTIKIDTDITITYDQSNYSIPAMFDCFALVIDLAETSATANFSTSYGTNGYIEFYRSGDVGIIFINADMDRYTFTAEISPCVGGFNGATITFGNNLWGAHQVSNGKYYVMHPSAITNVDNGTISLSMPEWGRVDL